MKCEKCDKEIEDNSKFCVHCGEKVKEKNDQTKKKETEDDRIPKGLSDVRNHLEFIGYDVNENQIEDSGIIRFLATHPNRSILIVAYFPSVKFFTFVANYRIKKISSESGKNKLSELINQFNNNSIISTFSVSNDSDTISCASWYPDFYSKKDFSCFIEFFENEVTSKFKLEEFKEFLTE